MAYELDIKYNSFSIQDNYTLLISRLTFRELPLI